MAACKRFVQFGASSRAAFLSSQFQGFDSSSCGSLLDRIHSRQISQLVKSNGTFLVDTLKLTRGLEAQGVPSKQAEAITTAITEVLNDSLENVSHSFVSKAEMQKSEMLQESKLAKFKSEVQSSQVIIYILWDVSMILLLAYYSRHIASECATKSLCWNCREPGHMASNCPNEGICHTCGKAGHGARECTAPPLPPGDLRLCNNCYKQGHIAVDCTNEKACNNCRKTGHLARDCPNDPICNLCNISGRMARSCPKANMLGDRGIAGGGRGVGGGYRDIVCRSCHQLGHMSRDFMCPMMICHNCGGRGHLAFECPSGRYMDRYPRRY